jgi:hypothetical protein
VTCHPKAGPHVPESSALAGVRIDARCADCHRDHHGERVSEAAGTRICMDCHGDFKRRHPRSTLAEVHDFRDDHPQFRVALVDAATGKVSRVSFSAAQPAVERSGLKFPHATHLVSNGVRSPSGNRVLHCETCHEKDETNQRFQPVRMEPHCSECHRLEFEPAVTSRQAPHGDVALILTTLREFYSSVALGDQSLDVIEGNDLLSRPASRAPQPRRANAATWADRKARAVAQDLIETRVCVQCHEVARGPGIASAPWAIAPVRITEHWLPGASFDHKSHRTATCESCHAVRPSKSSADVSIPDLASCRTCHAGAKAEAGKIRSPCQMCHGYHQQVALGEGSKSAASNVERVNGR